MVVLFDSLNTRRKEETEIVYTLLNQYSAIFKHESNDILDYLDSSEVIIFHDNSSAIKNRYKGKKWLIEYSGSIQAQYINDEKYGSLPAEKLFQNLEEFLKYISSIQRKIQREDFNVLYDFDPVLESKLRLLHLCLAPGEITEAENGYTDLIKLLNKDEKKDKIKSAFKEMETIIKKENVDCFDKSDITGMKGGYIGALENLRKSLEPY
jgi:hypothetical protein